MTEYTFVCYAHEDTKFALKLARHLHAQGISVWFDQWQEVDNEQWDWTLEEVVKRCQNFLVILSPAAVNSWLVQSQTLQALQAERDIIPILFEPCRIPDPLQAFQPLNFAQNSHLALENLTTKLKATSTVVDLSLPKRTWLWLRWNGQLWGAGLLLLLLVGLGSLYFGSQRNQQRVVETALVPEQVQPVIIDEPLFVPTSEIIAPVANLPESSVISRFRPQDGSEMVLISASDFLMGSTLEDDAANSDEFPQHLVYLDAFWIDKTEVTNDQYFLCVEAGVCDPAQAPASTFQDALLPVVGVTWQQAATYCAWTGSRLPTEAEWEKAARGVDGRLYPWGNIFDSARVNYCDTTCVADWRDFSGNDGHRYTAPVGSFPQGVSPYGVMDMSGNVWEWTADWYAANTYQTSAYRNPSGPEDGVQRVIRGGSWYYSRNNMRVTQRQKDVPTSGYDNIGFRCVASDTAEPNP